jgi:hypothetical protein
MNSPITIASDNGPYVTNVVYFGGYGFRLSYRRQRYGRNTASLIPIG